MTRTYRNKRGHFVREQAYLKCRFYAASLHAKCILFNAYCTPMYGCQLWNSTYEYNFKRLKIAYNDAFRVLLNVFLDRRTSAASSLFVSHGIPTLDVIRKSILYRQHCVQCNAPVFKLPRARFWGFSPRREDTLHRLGEIWHGGGDLTSPCPPPRKISPQSVQR